jgi:hypothetical protein
MALFYSKSADRKGRAREGAKENAKNELKAPRAPRRAKEEKFWTFLLGAPWRTWRFIHFFAAAFGIIRCAHFATSRSLRIFSALRAQF